MIFVDEILTYFRNLGHAAEYGTLAQLNEQLTNGDYAASTDGMVAFVRLIGEQRTVDGYDTCDIAVHLSWLCPLDFDGETMLSTQEQAKDTLKAWINHLRGGNTVNVSEDARWQFGYDDFAENVAWVAVRVTLTAAAADCVPLVIPDPPVLSWWGLKFTMPEGGTVILRKNGTPNSVNLEVSTDSINWQPWTIVGTDYSYTLEAGQTLCIRNTSETRTGFSINALNYWQFVFNAEVSASGSIMSLICNNEDEDSLGTSTRIFYYLFGNCSTLIKAPDLPATKLSGYCYSTMFFGCNSLTEAPALPATELSTYCYDSMFIACGNLEKAPELNATQLATYCYNTMFGTCLNLKVAPALPATVLQDGCYRSMFIGSGITESPYLRAETLVTRCYDSMFNGCNSLKKIQTAMTNISASNCLNNWVFGVAPNGDFYCNSNLVITTGQSGIPSGWTRNNL